MKQFQQKRRFQKIIYSSGAIVILVLVALFFFNSTWDVYRKAKETAEKRGQAQAELDKLKEQEEYLRSQIDRLSTEKGIEEEVRTKFNVAKEDEGVIVIVDGENKGAVQAESEVKAWWQFWK